MERSTTVLRELRRRKGWSLAQASVKIGVGINTLNRWELGQQKPYGHSLQKLAMAYGIDIESLDSSFTPLPCIATPLLSAFVASDLSMRLLAAADPPYRSFLDVQRNIQDILEEFDAMTINPITRRDALYRLAALATLPFTSLIPGAKQPVDYTLACSAASIVACRELGKNADLALAFEGASAVLAMLAPIVKDSPRYRKQAAILATQAATLQTVFGRHLYGPESSIGYGLQAVQYGKESGDNASQVLALTTLSWSYYHIPRTTKQALQTAEQAVAVLKDQRKATPMYMHGTVYSGLAVIQAKNGLPSDEAFRLASKTAFSDQQYALFVDNPTVTLIRNEAEAKHHQGSQGDTLAALTQLVDNNLSPKKYDVSEREHIRALSLMTKASLNVASKDLEQSVSLWKTWMQHANTLKSELCFDEALFEFHVMDRLWGNDARVQALRPLTVHW